MKYMLISMICMVAISSAYGQAELPGKNKIVLELGGMAAHYSLNYERDVYFDTHSGLTLGLGFAPTTIDFGFSPRMPVRAIFFRKINQHKLSAGVGVTPYFMKSVDFSHAEREESYQLSIAYFGQIGYTYQWHERYEVGAAFMPGIDNTGFFPWAALRLGYRF